MKIRELIETLSKFDLDLEIGAEDERQPDFAYSIHGIDAAFISGEPVAVISLDFDSPLILDFPDEEETSE